MRRFAFVPIALLTVLLPVLRGQTSLPIGLTGFTGDIILAASESPAAIVGNGTDRGTTISVSNWDFYEAGASVTNGNATLSQGLPSGSRTFTAAGVEFQFASYTGNNVVVLNPGSATLPLVSPGAYSDLHFLMTMQGSTGSFNATLNFSDSTSATTTTYSGITDWTLAASGGSNALANMGLVGSGNQVYSGPLYLRDFDFTLAVSDQGKTLDSITINYINGGPLMFFAASGTVSAVPEPSTCAALFGAGALAFAAWRRQSRRENTTR